MLQESEIAAQVNLGDSAAPGSRSQGDATKKWQTEFQQTRGFTSISSDSGAENLPVSRLGAGNKALDLFPSPIDIWSQTIDSWKKPGKAGAPGIQPGAGDAKPGTGDAQAGTGDAQHGDMTRVEYQKPGQTPAPPQTPMDRLGLAMDKYESGGKKLTADLRREFENIITASDVPSPLVPGMKQRLTELAAEGKKLLTDSKKKEIDDTRLALETSVKALSPEKQRQIQGHAQARSFARGDEKLTKGFETQMEQVAPGLLTKLKAYEKATEPLSKIEDEYGEISEQLAAEQGQSIITRSTYADLLIKSGDKTTAAKHLRDAATKEPTLLENPEFIELLTGAGLKASDLKKRP